MDLVHMATCSIRWAILWSTESNKSSRWSLMDLVHMATCSIRWAIPWSTESAKIKQNQVVDFDGLRVVRVKDDSPVFFTVLPEMPLKRFCIGTLIKIYFQK